MSSHAADSSRLSQFTLAVGALGVVYGDIGTSPLYTFRECLGALPPEARATGILGVLSLIFWALLVVVTLKYVWFISWADNGGEGGIFALLALSTDRQSPSARISPWILFLRLGAALLYMAGTPRGTPLVLLHHLKANRSLRENVVILSALTDPVPYVAAAERVQFTEIGAGVWRLVERYGYMESPDAGALLDAARALGCPVKPKEATYYFNHEMVVSGGGSSMWEW